MKLRALLLSVVGLVCLSSIGFSDEIASSVENSLSILGLLDPSEVDGVVNEKTELAIAKYQMNNDMPVTGEPSIQLAAALELQAEGQQDPNTVAGGAETSSEAADSAQAKAGCKKGSEVAHEAKKKTRLFGRLARAGGVLAGKSSSKAYSTAANASYKAGAAETLAGAAESAGTGDCEE